jgi:GalNAc5-diNAcBac-PP-undecaprenol beta-1,3-glucosyltransferase
MTRATVLIPTHERVASLRVAVQSAREQTLQDFELFIVGDGVSEATRELARELCAADDRIRFFDFDKAPGQGELNRHRALQEARGRFVAYLGDDDCWMPNHLEVLDELLAEADFCHTLQVGIDRDGQVVVMPADLQNPSFRQRMLTDMFNRFDFTFAGHSLEAYRRLPYGWRTTPIEFPWTDLYMWRQFLAEPWCRVKSGNVPTGVNTWSHLRPHLSDRERADELIFWRGRIADPAFRETLWRLIAQRFAAEAVAYEMDLLGLTMSSRAAGEVHEARADELARCRDALAAAQAEQARLQASLVNSEQAQAQSAGSLGHSEAALAAARRECEQGLVRIRELEADCAATSATSTAIVRSKSWRYTHPLRLAWEFARTLAGRAP